MKRKTVRMAQSAVIILSVAVACAYEFGPGPGYAGAPGDSTCAQCHGNGTVNTGGGKISFNLASYAPGVTQHAVVTIADPTARRWGFEATARLAGNTEAGSLTPTDGNTHVESNGPLQYIEHTLAGTRLGTTGQITFEFDWNPPANGGDVTFYMAANAANGNNQADPGDHIYTASFTLTAAAPPQSGPTISATNGVVNGASFVPGIAPGSWITIFGTNLAAATRTWRPDEIVAGKLPLALDGVSVTVNGKSAAVYFISPTQLNVQAPDDNATGSVEVKVANAQGSASASATLSTVAPGLFLYDQGGHKYVAAQHADFSVVGSAGLIPGVNSSPARPGEVIILYGTGFGPGSPPAPAGQVVGAPSLIDASQLSVQVGGAPAEVQFAGITIAGVWQINVKIPAGLPAGDTPVAMQLAGSHTQSGALMTIAAE